MRTSRARAIVVLAVATAVLAIAPAGAQIFFTDTVTIVFARSTTPAEMAWSDGMTLMPEGLGMPPPWPPDTSRNFWLRTPPLALGPSWRPPTSASVKVTLDNVQTAPSSMRPYIRGFARYSADRVHWSSWFPLAPSDTTTLMPPAFEGRLTLPRAAREQYDALMSKWWMTNPAWSSDEHDFCLWLAAGHRSLFDAEIPFIGYTQVLLEGGALGLRILGLNVKLDASGSGLESIPRGARRPTAEGTWFFDLSKTSR
jgi:hypothetical protein